MYSVFSLCQLAPDYHCLVSPKPNNMGNERLCITWDSWRRGALCPFKKGMDMRLCALSELQPRKLHFTFQDYFGADFTVPSLPAGGTHSTSFSSCCLAATEPRQKSWTLCPRVPATAPVPAACHSCQGRVGPATCWEVSSSNISSIGAFCSFFPRFCFVPIPHWLLFEGGESHVTPEAWLLCCFSFLSLYHMVRRRGFSAVLCLSSGPRSLLWWLPCWEEGTSPPSCFLCSQGDHRTPRDLIVILNRNQTHV